MLNNNLIGQKFGKLTVVDIAPKTKNRSITWVCKCDCGKICKIRNANLLSGTRMDCGCVKLPKNVIGLKFNRLTILSYTRLYKHHKMYLCKCECGNIVEVSLSDMKQGFIKSCGCLAKEIRTRGNVVHGLSKTRINKIYRGMIERCSKPNNINYPNYGGRGIKVCDEWLGPQGLINFYAWAQESGYEKDLSIDRINNNGNYEPSNCRWATRSEQQNNTRKNRKYELNGELYTIPQLSRKYNIDIYTLRNRLEKIEKYGNLQNLLNTPVNKNKSRAKKESG